MSESIATTNFGISSSFSRYAPTLDTANPGLVSAQSLLFIDSRVADIDSLIQGAKSSNVFILDSSRDGVEQILDTVAQYQNVASVHIVSHGNVGSLQLGNTTLSNQTIPYYGLKLQSIAQNLTADADILLYGCDVGLGGAGLSFLNTIAQLTGADIAASNDLTGNRDLGGDWDLEVNIGAIESSLAFHNETLFQYYGILPFLSDLSWTSTNGWGPVERDRANGEQSTGDGGVLTLNGVTYTKGLGVHAGSEIIYALNGGYTRFTSDIGVDDSVGGNGSVVFQVWADGIQLYDSGTMTGSTATRLVDVDLTGRQSLRLVVTDGGNGNAFDHADWANAQLLAGPPPPDTTAPTASSTLANITTSGTGTYDFTVTYTDNQSVNVTTIDSSDLRVTGPNSFNQLATLVSVSPAGNGTPRTATYRITAPGGAWDIADNGAYTVTLQANQVADVTGNAIATAALGTFQVGIGTTTSTFLSDLSWTSTNGWGPVERDRANGEQSTGDGGVLTLNGVTYTKGLGVHAGSEIIYALNGGYTRFTSDIGVDDSVGGNGSVVFQVWADGVQLYTSGLMTGSTATRLVDVDLTGRQSLRLVVTDNANGNNFDHANWANAQLLAGTPTPDTTPPTATATAANLTTGGVSSYDFTVTYTDDRAINLSTIDGSDVRVTGPNSFSQLASLVSVTPAGNGTPRTATYRITAPGGIWDPADNGAYTVALLSGQVADLSGNSVAAAASLATFQVNVTPPAPDTTAPTATTTLANITTSGTGTYDFTVTYTDNQSVNVTTIDSSDLRVTGLNSFNQLATLVSVSPAGNGTPRTATYRITAPGGAWDIADNGAYTVTLQANQVADVTGNAIAATTLGTFQVNVGTGGTGTAAFLSDLSWTSTNGWGPVERDRANGEQGLGDGGVLTLNGVTYAKGIGVHAGSEIIYALNGAYTRFTSDIGVDDYVGTNGSVVFQVWADGVQLYTSGTMTGSTATRLVDVDLTGRQSLRLLVTDSGNGNAFDHADWANAQLLTGPPAADTAAPTATATAANITTGGASSYDFTVTYTDNQSVNISTIDSSDVRVTGPNSFSQLASLVSVSPAGNGTPRSATYRITAPGGAWDLADNGTYTVALQANQVADVSGNAIVATTLGTFQVNVTPPGADTTAPTATLTATPLDTSRTTPYTFTVNYADATAVNVSTINSADIRVTGPNGFSQLAQFVSATPNTNGAPVTATYQLIAPDGIWNWNDRGTYTATLLADEVRDTLGNATTTNATLGTFQVTVPSTIVLGTNSSQVTEGGTVTIPIQRTGDTTGTATINYFTGGNSTAVPNVHYVPIPVTTLTFAPGEAQKNVVVQTLNDGVSGTSRTVSLLIETPAGADLGPSRTSSISIVDQAAATRTYLSDLNWTSATNGWGPVEQDRSNGEDGAGDGGVLTLNGVTYTKGLGVHAGSEINYALGGAYNSFFAYIGVNDGVGSNGSVVFQIWADGTQLYDSGVMTGTSATRLANVDVTGRQNLRLIVTNGGDNINYDHANWADAQLVVGSYTPPPPTTPPGPPPPPTSFTREQVVGGLNQPTTFDWSPDGRLMFIAEKSGIVRVSIQGTAASPQFADFQPYTTGTDAHSVTAVDLNGDGRLDLAVANSGNNTVSVLFGRADGTFNAATNYGVGSAPKSVFAADVNGDGRLDLLTSNQDSNNISVLINNSNGTFAPTVNYAGPNGAHEVVAADVDGDGDIDIAATGWGGSVVSILRNNGTGTFGAATNYTVGSSPHSLQLADFNGDGRPDLAVASLGSNAASILLNTGTGTFGSVINYAVGTRPHSIRAGDLNGDGRIDLATANDGDGSVSVLLGNGNGTFASAVRYATGSVPKGIAIGDINGDGRLDLVTANTAGNYPNNSNNPGGNTVSVLLGNGNGTFAAPVAYTTGNTPFNLALADFNGDGRLDIATANWFSNNIGVLLNTTPPSTIGLQAAPFIDISAQVNNVADRGLLGLAIDPLFGQNQGRDYVYLLFTYDPPETQGNSGLAGPDGAGNRPARLIRVTANPATNYTTALPNSEVVLLGTNSLWQYTSRPDTDSTDNFSTLPSGIVNGSTITAPAALIEDPDSSNIGRDYSATDTNFTLNNNIRDYLAGDSTSHSIGQIQFGTDGFLYVTVGDGTSYNGVDWRSTRVQDIDNLSGKLLRINPLTGQGVSDNPFFNGNLDSNRSKVWGLGFRNAFRFTIQPGTGTPYLGDVGWNSWEEINVGTRGGNFGWPYFEGTPQNAGYSTLPQAQAFYTSGQSVVSPFLARNHSSSLNPDGRATTALIMGDFYSGNTFPSIYNGALFYNDVGLGTVYVSFLNANGTVSSTQVFDNLPYIVDMETGPDGSLYYASLYGGEIGRWRPS